MVVARRVVLGKMSTAESKLPIYFRRVYFKRPFFFLEKGDLRSTYNISGEEQRRTARAFFGALDPQLEIGLKANISGIGAASRGIEAASAVSIRGVLAWHPRGSKVASAPRP